MRITESQIRKIIRNEVHKGKHVNEAGSPMNALDRLNAAFHEFMDAGGNIDELVENALGFAEDWENSQGDPDSMSIETQGMPSRGYGRYGTIADND